MAIEVCVRCGARTVKTNNCEYCGRLLCVRCIKSSKKPSKTKKLYICKDCWGKMDKRKEYKHVGARAESEEY